MPIGSEPRCPNGALHQSSPQKSNRRFPAEFDIETYKWRHLIENHFGKLKENRGIAKRSCKTDQSFKAFISLPASIIQLR